MAAGTYTRRARALGPSGISGAPADQLPPNKVPYVLNMRTYQPGTLQPRSGIRIVNNTNLGTGINAIARLNDVTSFATVHQQRFVGMYTHLCAGNPNTVPTNYAIIDSGYSAEPLTFVTAAPPQSPRPFLYVVDSLRMRKVNTDRTLYPVGLRQPLLPPVIALQAQGVTVVSELDAHGSCAAVGAVAGAVTDVSRINTTIVAILYDNSNTGYASIQPTSMDNIGAGARIAIAAAETVTVDEVIPAIATTTIATIVYDAGSSGLCWIQPVASLGTGQLDPIPYATYLIRAGAGINVRFDPNTLAGPLEFGITPDLAPTPVVPRRRVIDFPVNGLITLGGTGETVRIQAIAVGPDGVQAFRCYAANTHAAGDSITGVPCFRAATTGTRAATNTLVDGAITNTLTAVATSGASQTTMVGGISSAAAVNGALVGGRAILADDILHLSIKVDHLTYVNSIRVYLDVDAAGAGAGGAFLQNYFLAEWRASDIIKAIQATNAQLVDTITGALPTAVINDQVDPGPGGYYGGGTGGTGNGNPPAQ